MSCNGKRLSYFDMMKGVAIFLVVMGHVITMCIREIDRTPLFKFIGLIHMPLFFFISGWFAFKSDDTGKVKFTKPGTRALRLLLPMIAVSSLWVVYFPHSGLQSPINSTFGGLWSDTWKNGYWFTLVLFEIFMVYGAVTPLMSRWKGITASVLLALATWGILLAVFFLVPQEITSWVSLELVASFFPAFMFGVIARRYRERFSKWVHSQGCQTINIIVLALLLYICSWPWEFEMTRIWEIVFQAMLHITVAITAFVVFERWSGRAFAEGVPLWEKRVAEAWVYVGKQSLGIYLLHYFFLFPMGDLFRGVLLSVNLSFVPVLLFSAFWATIIIAVVIGVIKLLAPSRILSLLLTGQMN